VEAPPRHAAARGGAVILATSLLGDASTGSLLVLSQVVLSLQLPFAVIPLVLFTGSRARMGQFASPLWLKATAWAIAASIVALNIAMLADARRVNARGRSLTPARTS